ncbi:MAG: carbonic anhydrase, partial [Planctomycetota bacterium]
HWAIVTCMSCDLIDFIHKTLGFKRGDALLIQNAGNTITPYDNSIIRSLAVGIYMLGVKEIAVIGHTHCGMKMDVAPLTDAFAKYGKSRDMLKDVDLREWFGIITNEEINIRKVVDAIKQSPVIPQEIPVYGLMIDNKGKLNAVYHHQEAMRTPSSHVISEPKPNVTETKPAKEINVKKPEPSPREKNSKEYSYDEFIKRSNQNLSSYLKNKDRNNN